LKVLKAMWCIKTKTVKESEQAILERVVVCVTTLQTDNLTSRFKFRKFMTIGLWIGIPFIFFTNYNSLLPNSYGCQSTTFIPYALSFMYLGAIYINVARLHSWMFIGHWIANGVNIFLKPVIVYIEFISNLLKPISLATRLLANITAGHILLDIIGHALISISLSAFLVIGYVAFGAIFALELLVCGLQVAVFFSLVGIYARQLVKKRWSVLGASEAHPLGGVVRIHATL
jgi:ATP synthase subunit 6